MNKKQNLKKKKVKNRYWKKKMKNEIENEKKNGKLIVKFKIETKSSMVLII